MLFFSSNFALSEASTKIENNEAICQPCSELSKKAEGSISCMDQSKISELKTTTIIIAKPPINSRTSVINLGYENSGNTAYGSNSLPSNQGNTSAAFGYLAMQNCNNCGYNVAVGHSVRGGNLTGAYNVAVEISCTNLQY